MAITSYTVPPSSGENSTSRKSELVQDLAEYPSAGVAASSTAECAYRVSTAVPPGVEYRFCIPDGVGPWLAPELTPVGMLEPVDRDGETLGACVLGPCEGTAAGADGGALVASAAPIPVEAGRIGQAATVATCGPSTAAGSTESSPAHTTAIALAVAAAQARTAYTARLGTLAALPSVLAPRCAGTSPVHWRTAVNPLGCHTMARVLLVEDDPDIRSTVIRQLSEFGHSVRSAGTALAALREATRDPGDVIVLDLGLPDLDGSEALKMLRAVTGIPVIIATARDDEGEIIRLLHAGADDYLVKPYSAAHLAARIAAVLRRTGAGAAPSVLRVGGLEDRRRAAGRRSWTAGGWI